MDAWLYDTLTAKRVNAFLGTHLSGDDIAAMPEYRVAMLTVTMEVLGGKRT